MAFNLQITRIGENTNDRNTKADKTNNSHLVVEQNYNVNTGLVNVPADHTIRKYPVRIFNMQPEG